jgi:O-antigen ligase
VGVITPDPPVLEPAIATGLVALLAVGSTIAAAGAISSALVVVAVGGLLLGAALVALAATDWIDGLAVVILATPLPALVSSDSVNVATAAPVTAAVVFAWLLRRSVRGTALQSGRLPARTLSALMFVFVLAAVFSTHPITSVRELLNIVVLFCFLILVIDRLCEDQARVHSVATLLAAIAAIVSVLAVLEMVGIIPGQFPRSGTDFNRAAVGFGQPNGLGLFLAIVIPLVVYLARHGEARTKLAAQIALPITLLGLFSTFSRAAWVALLIGSGALLFARGARFTLRVWLIAILFGAAVEIGSGGALRDTAERTAGDWSIQQRLLLQATGIFMFIENPVLGVGPGAYADHIDRYSALNTELFDVQPTPHNAYVQMLAETGAGGFIAFVAFLGAGLLGIMRSARNAIAGGADAREIGLRHALLWSFATLCIISFFIWPFGHGTGQVVLVVMAAAFAVDGPPASGVAWRRT